MLKIDTKTKQINITRGDVATLEIKAKNADETDYIFQINDVVRFKVLKARDCNCVELQKDVVVEKEMTSVKIELTKEETKLGDVINKPIKYWYEVELNPNTKPQTIIGYDLSGEKMSKSLGNVIWLKDIIEKYS